MRAYCAFRSTLAFCLIFTVATEAVAQRRVALVIGNSGYANAPRLDNPANDAADIAGTLSKLNFDVTQSLDLDKASMDRTIRNFAESLSGAQLGLFFYAGHGLQVGGQNYLVPVDAKLTSATAIDFETIRLDLVQRAMERGTMTNILILDACRDNPLARNLARALGSRSSALGNGLAPMESGEGTLISFSTQPGNVALDGLGRNSPFATALLKHIPEPGNDLPTILINVRNDVMSATARKQVPWEHSALTAKVYFTPPQPVAKAPTHEQQVELTFWLSVKDSTSPTILRTYLERYPDGEFAVIARALIDHYGRQAKAALAARERELKQHEEEKKAAEVKRLEDERRVREATLVEARARAEEAKNSAEVKRLEEKERAEHAARGEQLRKALEEANRAKEALKAADEKRLAAAKAAEDATRVAEQAIVSKKETSVANDPAKIAALPKVTKSVIDGAGTHWLVGRWRGEVKGMNDGRIGDGRTLIVTSVTPDGKVVGRWTGETGQGGEGTIFDLSGDRLTITTTYSNRVYLRSSGPNRLSGYFLKTTEGKRFAVTLSRQ